MTSEDGMMRSTIPMFGRTAAFAVIALAGCTLPEVPSDAPPDMAAFRLGHTVVVADNAQLLPFSRQARAEELEAALKEAVVARLGAYEGAQLYHLGIHVDGYALAAPGVPLLVSPKSALVVSVTVWDNAAGGKINADPHQITVFETLSGSTVLGSGLTRSREAQLAGLAANAARAIHDWMLTHPEWFAPRGTDAASGDGTVR